MNRLQTFIEHLRGLDESAKQVWLFILSGITMLLVIMLWFMYLNITIIGVPPAEIQQVANKEIPQNAEQKKENPLFANFKRNTSQIYSNLKKNILGIINMDNEIIIEK